MIHEQTKGVFVISVTPFKENGDIDYAGVDRVSEFYLAQGAHGLTILGMMGEAPKLTMEESIAFTKYILARVQNRVPVIVGVSSPGLANLTLLAKIAVDAGAAGVLVAPVAGLRTDDQVFDYYASVCQALGPDIAVVVQDYPQSTNVFLSIPVILRLVQSFKQIKMLKHEDCPGLNKITRIREESSRENLRRVSILVGNGGLYYPLELRRGADGAMTGFAYPEMLVAVYHLFCSGDSESAENLFDLYLPLLRYEQQPGFGLAVRKEILRRRGAIHSAVVRTPGPKLTVSDQEELTLLMKRLEQRIKA
jgi:4-hydroxy-tetrahydrodipicolinate synthase